MKDSEKDALTSKMINSLARASGGSVTVVVGKPGSPKCIRTGKGSFSGPSLHAAAVAASKAYTAPTEASRGTARLAELIEDLG